MVTSSIEAEYILLGYPGPIDAPTLPAIAAFDKVVEKPISERQVLVGIEITPSIYYALYQKKKLSASAYSLIPSGVSVTKPVPPRRSKTYRHRHLPSSSLPIAQMELSPPR
jgi:hypothetical protein